MANRQWKDLTRTQKTALASAGLLQFGLLGAALFDVTRRPASQIQGRKRFWIPFIFVNFIGPLAYFARGRKPAV